MQTGWLAVQEGGKEGGRGSPSFTHAYSTRTVQRAIQPPSAFQCIAQPNMTLLDCILYPMQYLYDPGVSSSSANQCSLGNLYLKSDLSRKENLKSALWSITCVDVIFRRASRAQLLQPKIAKAAVPSSAHVTSLVHTGTICYDSHQLGYARLIYMLLNICKTNKISKNCWQQSEAQCITLSI